MLSDPQQLGLLLKWLLTLAWLLPLGGFVVEIASGFWAKRTSRLPSFLAIGCVAAGFVFSVTALGIWSGWTGVETEAVETVAHQDTVEKFGPNAPLERAFMGTYYRLAKFGDLSLSLDYYIDGLTLIMFVMVTLIATCIHVFAAGYMDSELTHWHTDHAVKLSSGEYLQRPGRSGRFFAFLSLFCFSMLGLVLAGNLFQVFIFWELVGLCSYLLIGFYSERNVANSAANKAFIMNRIGDFGFLIGLMILWTSVGVFHFAETSSNSERGPGLFQQFHVEAGHLPVTGEGNDRVVALVTQEGSSQKTMPYWLLTAAGLGIFAGCVGKSAQFPLQTWLPDAMQGPTPVSALVHSATMVAAGVYLVGRFYPLLTPEALLVIAYVGCVTLFIGATIALVVTDIKQVLAYSTISQLGYMMLAMGVGGWMAGLFHLIAHAFFKSLLFLCSGSVIHGCHHEQEMTRMGGLHKKMPVTCWTMFIGVVAICGLAVPVLPQIPYFGTIAFSGYHSKDSILATALAFASLNPTHSVLFLLPLMTAGLTAFYMFRMWFMTFFGEVKDVEVFEEAHESPLVMTVPLFVLAFFAITVGMGGEAGPLVQVLHTAEPAHVAPGSAGGAIIAFPGRHEIFQQHVQAGAAALTVAFAGTILAYLFYAVGWVNVRSIQQQFGPLSRLLMNKWEFDALYEAVCVRPVQRIAACCATFDRAILDMLLDRLASGFIVFALWERQFDAAVVDRAVDVVGESTQATGRVFRLLQTGRLRQYVMSIAVSVVALFILLFVFLPGR